MYKLLSYLITNPLIAFVAVIITWIILYLLLVRIGKLKRLTCVRLEYVWIGIGFFGVLTIIDENRRNHQIMELDRIDIWIENDYNTLLSFLGNSQSHCAKYINTGLFSQEEFNQIQARTDTICLWTKQVYDIVDSTYSKGKLKIVNIPSLNVDNPENDYSYERTLKIVNELNQNIESRDELLALSRNQFWNDFKYSFGIILLILAFGLRLTIISQKVRDEKNNI